MNVSFTMSDNQLRPVYCTCTFCSFPFYTQILIASRCLNMPGCAAVGCNNRSEKGYIMKCFPRDPKLRKIWQERVARADWEPSNNSFLCHVHFEPQQWSVTQNGRIRLKKNAVPSIFTVTSTRKSPRKKTKIFDNKDKSIFQSEYNTKYMEHDTEDSSMEHLEEKGLGLHRIEESSVLSIKNTHKSSGKELRRLSQEVDHQAENNIMIAEDNLDDIGDLGKQCNFKVEPSEVKKGARLSLMANNSENSNLPSAVVKEEIKLEIMDHNTFEDSYDEIEEKLKQICDGGSTEDENYKNNANKKLMIKGQKEDEGKEEKMDTSNEMANDEPKAALSIKVSHKFQTKSDVGPMLTDKEENVEIIFGTESGDEKMPTSQITSKLNKLCNNVLEYDEIICIKDEKRGFNEDIEENFTKDEVHVIPNIRAAMKRKRRTREEIMKSIKKSIKSTSDQDFNSMSNSGISEEEVHIRNELSLFAREINNLNNDDLEMGTAKFVIKVTGDPDDVTEIIEELSSSTIGTQVSKSEENEAFVTSVITVLSRKTPKEIVYRDFSSPLTKEDYITSSTKISPVDNSLSGERGFTSLNSTLSSKICHCFKHTYSNEGERPQAKIISPLQNSVHNVETSFNNNTECATSDYEDLLERIQIQEDVIAKLTDQLIIYKELENSLRNKNNARDIQNREVEAPRMNTRSSSVQSSSLSKRNLQCKQRLIEDLSNRVNYFEEMNKKLMKTVTLESQQKRKLEGQIKQKDNRIKELNWKLEKASKYLERAEKNTNTYRRKMLNMQTIMRRRKLLDEKMSKFNEMLIDSSKQEFSEKVLVMATDIRRICGRKGYDKLLSYGFPLPPLPALRKEVISEDLTDPNKSDIDDLQNSTNISVKIEKAHGTNNDSDIDGKDTELPDSVSKTEYETTETVTGTVQDIFDENNDGDDFSTNELREHFILQLNAVM